MPVTLEDGKFVSYLPKKEAISFKIEIYMVLEIKRHEQFTVYRDE
jgi:hypothetical protein